MEVGVSLHQLRDVGRRNAFEHHWPRVDVEAWPGRELHWVWCHPALSIILFATVLIIIIGGVTS